MQDDRTPPGGIEIVLTDHAAAPEPLRQTGAGDDDRSPRSIRRRVLLGVVGAMIAGAITIVVNGDDDPPVETATSSPTTASAPTPSIDVGVDALPAPRPVEPAPSPFEAPSDTAHAAGIDVDDLFDAVARLDTTAPLRTTTAIEIGAGGYRLDVVSEVAIGGRYDLEIGAGAGLTTSMTVDLATGESVFGTDGAPATVLTNAELADRLGSPDIETLLDRLLLGPIRAATIDAATAVELGPVVNVGGGPDPFGRQFFVELPASAAREWAPYQLGPRAEAAPPDDGTNLRFEVYVSAQSEITRITATIPYGSTVQRIDHRFDHRG